MGAKIMEAFISTELQAVNVGAIAMALIATLSGGLLFWLRERT